MVRNVMTEHPLDRPYDELLKENAELRGVLWEQWESNHSEHCDRIWPHPEGKDCHWPLPDVLTRDTLAGT